MAKWVALTARKLKPGSYDDWRQAWDSGDAPEGVTAYICRNVNDPDEIVAFGIIDASAEQVQEMKPAEGAEEARTGDGAARRVDGHRRLLRGHRRSHVLGGSGETVTVPPESHWRPRCGVLRRPRTH